NRDPGERAARRRRSSTEDLGCDRGAVRRAPRAAPGMIEEEIMADARNVFGEPLSECCTKPLTGFYRTGSCETGPGDVGVHTVCTRVDAEFLAFSRSAGNGLSPPVPAAGSPGLLPRACWLRSAGPW